ncbi:MAG: metal-dependent hydrolase, partial [Clostridia bacterium]|nr:metal-dependent hydrolase [Clostridia bacterium]
MIIDFHTHIFPDKIAERVIATLEAGIHNRFREDVRAVIGATLDDLKTSMAENNIDYSVVMPIAKTVTQYESINNFAQLVNETDSIFSFGSLHPMQENWE